MVYAMMVRKKIRATLEDLQVLEHALRLVADFGVPEALADPITD